MSVLENIYNKERKEEFLEGYPEESKNTFRYLFAKTGYIEDSIRKDLANFNYIEIEKVMYETNPHNYESAKQNATNIKNYISWAIKKGYRESNDPPLIDIQNRKWLNGFVTKNIKIFFSREEILEIAEKLHPQDQAMVLLMFEGAFGKELTELRHIKYEDVKWDESKIILTERDNYELVVSAECLNAVKEAFYSTNYKKYSRKANAKPRTLISSPYILKSIFSGRSTEDEPVSRMLVLSRIAEIGEAFNLELTTKGLQRSGIIHEAYKILKEKGKLASEDYDKIGEKYDFSKVNGYYNKSHMSVFLNNENMMNLYDTELVTYLDNNALR